MKKVMLSIRDFFARLFGKKQSNSSPKNESSSQPTVRSIREAQNRNHSPSPTTKPQNEAPHFIDEPINIIKEEMPDYCEISKNVEPIMTITEVGKKTIETPNIPIRLNFKQAWMLEFVRNNSSNVIWVGPSKVGKQWGLQVKKKKGYNSGHSRRVLLDLVEMGLLVKNQDGRYRSK
jgi:hypothetical protein